MLRILLLDASEKQTTRREALVGAGFDVLIDIDPAEAHVVPVQAWVIDGNHDDALLVIRQIRDDGFNPDGLVLLWGPPLGLDVPSGPALGADWVLGREASPDQVIAFLNQRLARSDQYVSGHFPAGPSADLAGPNPDADSAVDENIGPQRTMELLVESAERVAQGMSPWLMQQLWAIDRTEFPEGHPIDLDIAPLGERARDLVPDELLEPLEDGTEDATPALSRLSLAKELPSLEGRPSPPPPARPVTLTGSRSSQMPRASSVSSLPLSRRVETADEAAFAAPHESIPKVPSPSTRMDAPAPRKSERPDALAEVAKATLPPADNQPKTVPPVGTLGKHGALRLLLRIAMNKESGLLRIRSLDASDRIEISWHFQNGNLVGARDVYVRYAENNRPVPVPGLDVDKLKERVLGHRASNEEIIGLRRVFLDTLLQVGQLVRSDFRFVREVDAPLRPEPFCHPSLPEAMVRSYSRFGAEHWDITNRGEYLRLAEAPTGHFDFPWSADLHALARRVSGLTWDTAFREAAELSMPPGLVTLLIHSGWLLTRASTATLSPFIPPLVGNLGQMIGAPPGADDASLQDALLTVDARMAPMPTSDMRHRAAAQAKRLLSDKHLRGVYLRTRPSEL